MIRLKTLLGAAIFSAMAFTGANACSISAWSATDSVGVVAADSGEAPAFSRYSGRCSLRAVGGATAKYVQDNTPTNATSYKSRVYVLPTAVETGAGGFLFLARDGAGANLIRIALVGGNLQTTVTGSAAAIPAIPVTSGRYYSIELEWAQGAAAPFSIKVQGAGSPTAVTQTTTTNNPTGVLKDVRLGLSAGSTGTAFFDEYDSRRTTAPGRLLKCDANNDGFVTIADRVLVNNESLGLSLAAGQPDANEDGIVSIADRVQVNNKILNNPASLCN